MTDENRVIIMEEEKIHRFFDIHDNCEDIYCNVKVNVKHYSYKDNVESRRFYYDVTYEYHYVENRVDITKSNNYYLDNNLKTIPKTNPFYYYKDQISDDSLEGVIVVTNRVTEALIDQLLMDNDALSKEISGKWVVQYRAHIMYILSTMWD